MNDPHGDSEDEDFDPQDDGDFMAYTPDTPQETPSNLVEVVASFTFKKNLGNYQSVDFFASQKQQCRKEDAEFTYDTLQEVCRKRVLKALKAYSNSRGDFE